VRRSLALALAFLGGALGVLLLAAAFDVRRWHEQLEEGDAAFRAAPGRADLWSADPLLPGDPVRRLLGVDDDLRYRTGMQSFWAAHPRRPAFQHPELEAARAQSQILLRAVLEQDRDDPRRSQEATLLGVLSTAIAPRQERDRRAGALSTAATLFADAVRLDRTNEDAMFNLESVLRRIQLEPQAFESPGGRLPRDDASMGGLRDAGAGY
jgi:hypothetical protein